MDRSVLATRLRGRGFKVVEPLKCAGHAAIFRVSESDDGATESYVAKVVCLTGLDAQGQAGAHQEVSLLKGLSAHPNLIAYRESFLEEAGILFIVMSLAEDGDLRQVVAKAAATKHMLPEPMVLTWLQQTALGLDHLHQQGVVHRDLKSSNIFLCEGRRRIRIGDFGISTVLQSTAFASSCVGTPAYMSPELMRNERYDFHVDIWALGCICFELCALSMPFAASSLLQLAMQIMDAEPSWDLMNGRSEAINHICKWLLKKDVDQRPTARQLLDEPIFAGPGPSEEDWASLEDGELHSSPDKRRMQTTVSTMDHSGSESLSSSNPSGWTMTPRMPWDKSSRASGSTAASPGGLTLETAPASSKSERAMLRAKEVNKEFSKDEFAEMLQTHQDQLLTQLRIGLPRQEGFGIGDASGYYHEAHEQQHQVQAPETVI